MPMQPRPIAETSGPAGPSVRFFIALILSGRWSPGRPARRVAARPACLAAVPERARALSGGRAQANVADVFPLNLPNVLTVLRIMLVPVLVVALLGNTPTATCSRRSCSRSPR